MYYINFLVVPLISFYRKEEPDVDNNKNLVTTVKITNA